MHSKSKWPTILIVLLTLGLVFGPVFVPREIARWYLAAAHNAFRNKDSVLGEHYLKRSEAWDANIKRDGDYWIAQLPKVTSHSVDDLLDLVERAVMTDSRWTQHAKVDARNLSNAYDFQHAVRALKIASLGQRPTTFEDLNELAYMRAMAGIELEDALKDIDQAIALVGPEPTLLDTKAWVLYGMKHNFEAWGYANEAIKGWEEYLAKARVTIPGPLPDEPPSAPESQGASPGSSSVAAGQVPDTTAAESTEIDFLESATGIVPPISLRQRQQEISEARKRLGGNVFALAIMRFHRMRILEALKKANEAEADRAWLVERGVPVVDELF